MDPLALPVPPDSNDGKSSLVHRLLIASGQVGRISPAALLPSWIGLVFIAAWPWKALLWPAVGIATVALASDGAMLALLPVARRSWGPVTPPLLALTLLRTLLSWALALTGPTPITLGVQALLQWVVSGLAMYATWVEPARVGVTRQQLVLDSADPAPSESDDPPATLRLLHLSDLHYEGDSPRETALLAQVTELRPALILLTGDYLNLSSVNDPAAQAGARTILEQFQAPLGVYAVTGSPVVDRPGIVPQIFADLPIRWLDDEVAPVRWNGGELWLLGVRCTYRPERDAAALARLRYQVPSEAFTVLLYHTPDLMPEAARLGVRLYLAGHTHGGQIRLPLYGAIFTSSRYGKRYEMGWYQTGRTTLYVSRGLGMEGLGAPRARFLTPPEIVLWELSAGNGPSGD